MIEVRGLRKEFSRRGERLVAVSDVEFAVGRGEIVGFLGPNGAGKTTTLRMLTTLLAPTSGQATIAGCDLLRAPASVRRRIGYVAQGGVTAPEARVAEELADQAGLYGIARSESERRATALLERLELNGVARRQVKTLSGGQRRRLDIALGLVHEPPVLFLDEPTSGLDPQARANLWSHIRSLRDDDGATVFLTTHYLDEADVLCDRILVIDHGRIVAAGRPEELKQQLAGDTVVFAFSTAEDARRAAALFSSGNARSPRIEGHRMRLESPNAHLAMAGLLERLDRAALRPTALEVHPATLDDVFFALTGRALREEVAA